MLAGGGILAADAFHACAPWCAARRPGSAILVGCIDHAAGCIGELQRFTAVAERSGVEQAGRKTADGAVVGAFQEEVSSGRNTAGEFDFDVLAV